VYLTQVFHMRSVDAATLLNGLNGTTSLAPIIGAFLSDAYLGRYLALAIASVASLIVSPPPLLLRRRRHAFASQFEAGLRILRRMSLRFGGGAISLLGFRFVFFLKKKENRELVASGLSVARLGVGLSSWPLFCYSYFYFSFLCDGNGRQSERGTTCACALVIIFN
jgi:hypothetical protein